MTKNRTCQQLEHRVKDQKQESSGHKKSGNGVKDELKKFLVLYELATAMTDDRSLDENLRLLVDKSRELLGADTSYVALCNEARGDVFMHTLSGIRTEAFKKMRIPFGKGLGGLVAKTRQGYIIEDYFAERQLDQVVGKIVADEGVVSGMAVPIQMGAKNLGVLYVFNRKRTVFSKADLETLFLIANLAAVEISRKRTEEALQSERAQLLSIFGSINQVIYIADPKTYEILYVNKALSDAFKKSLVGSVCYKEFQGLESPCEFCTNEIILSQKYQPYEWEHHNPVLNRDFMVIDRIIKWPDGRDVRFEMATDITKRKIAEKALQESEERYRSILESIEEGYYEADIYGNFTFVNDSFCKIAGYSEAELLGSNYTHYADAAKAERTYQGFMEVFTTGDPIKEFVWEVITKNGARIEIETSAALMRDSEGHRIGFRGVIRDVTKRRRMEAELLSTKNFLENILDSSIDGITTTDLNGIITYVSPQVKNILGYPQDESIGKHAWNFYSDGIEEAKRIMRRLMETGQLENHEMKMIGKDGTQIDISVSVSLIKNEKGEVIGTLGIYRDVTKKRQMEKELRKAHDELEKRVQERTADLANANEVLSAQITQRILVDRALRQSEHRFRSLVETTSDLVWEVDHNATYTYASPKVKDLLGYEPEEIIGKTPFDLMPADERVHVAELFGDIVESRKPFVGLENTNLHKDGRQVVLETSGVPVLDASGNLVGYRGIDRDITQRKRVEVELQNAKEAAETANRAKSEFLANMSHELRTPLNHIIGFTELVATKQSGDLNDTQEEYLNDVLQSSKHLLSLINDILDLSKVEAGKHELEVADINPRVLLENSLLMVKEKATKHRIKIATDIEDIPETIRVDERKFKQIMYNLLSNAVKFTPDGGEVCLSARMLDCIVRPGLRKGDPEELEIIEGRIDRSEIADTKRKKCIEFSVADTGIGIKPEDQVRIFNPFEQVENSRSRRYQGTGLGLSLTKRFVEMHGGRIWTENKGEGKGSTFRFIIPAQV